MRIPHHILDDEYPVVISDNSDVASTLGETDAESYCPDNLEYILILNFQRLNDFPSDSNNLISALCSYAEMVANDN